MISHKEMMEAIQSLRWLVHDKTFQANTPANVTTSCRRNVATIEIALTERDRLIRAVATWTVREDGMVYSDEPLDAYIAQAKALAEQEGHFTTQFDGRYITPETMAEQYRNVVIVDDHIEGESRHGAGDPWIHFRGSAPLMKIYTVCGFDGVATAIWDTQDGYGEPGDTPPQGWDWSGIRDSSEAAIAAMETLAEQWWAANRPGQRWPWEG